MNYAEFIELHPAVDLALEFFKGICPTVVAIIAIIVNNALIKSRGERSREREKKKDINEARIGVLNTMLEKYIRLSQLFWISGTKLILFLSRENDEKKEIQEKEFEASLYEFQFKSQEIYDYFKSVFELYDFRIGCDTVVEDVREFAFGLIGICERYENTCRIEDEIARNKALDEAAEEIKEKTVEVKAWTHVVMHAIGQEIKRLQEE